MGYQEGQKHNKQPDPPCYNASLASYPRVCQSIELIPRPVLSRVPNGQYWTGSQEFSHQLPQFYGLGLPLRLGLAQIKPCLFNKLNQISPDAPAMPFLLSQQHTTEQVIYKEKILLRILEAWKFKRMVPTIGERHHRDPMAGVHETGAWGPKSSCCQDLVLQHF